ncbi:unnamed protein product [Chironomus riparius]|uniref:TIR domain-containing protein n=1 Tax=Chironomus riparius TaxID=315576 RepID=A0A9N9RK12_9DIPT|nr:unnamed protein product [Chironomus riparius]
MYIISIVLCTLVVLFIHIKVDVNCKSYVEKIDKSSKKTDTALHDDDVSISATINNASDISNSSLVDNVKFGNIEDTGESQETSQESLSVEKFFPVPYNFYSVESSESNEQCILERSDFYLSWWVYENGSLRLPTVNRTAMSGFLDLSLQLATESMLYEFVLSFTSQNPSEVIRIMSIANNKLSKIPSSVLSLTNSSIQYLSLADNNFYNLFEEENTTFENFTAFPLMTNLLELDLRNCHMTGLKSSYFYNLPSLFRLFVSHNYFTTINADDIHSLGNLQHLDISYNHIPPNYTQVYDGLLLEDELFKRLPRLMFLDLSYSKLNNNSVTALRHLGPTLTQLSLCHTELKTLEIDTFYNTGLKVLDLSGNKELYEHLTINHFNYLVDKLEILVFRDAEVSDKDLFTYLQTLRMLDLRNNQISSLIPYDFTLLKNLEIIDLGNNQIRNWQSRIFAENRNIKVLNLRHNNITVIKQEMLQDFYGTQYLAIGSNDFICACNLRDFIDRATRNALYHHCNERSKRSIDLSQGLLAKENQYNVFLREFHTIVSHYEESYRNILAPVFKKMNLDARYSPKGLNQDVDIEENTESIGLQPFNDNDCYNFDSNQQTHMNFNFLLLDYNENDYKCYDYNFGEYSSSNRSRYYFNEIDSCYNAEETTAPSYEGSSDDSTNVTNPPEEDETTTPKDDDESSLLEESFEFVYLNLLFIVPAVIIIVLWFWKRSDIKYFFSIFKNSLILSLDTDDKKALMLKNRKRSTNSVDQFTYDVFVSYSDNDRSWVLDELIPNIEKRTEINICLHERDFQVGLSILENIIQCMDKSRCLLLVVSESFLKSNWCSFEMHLAQHRLIETRREQLILVLLHDIPRARRSRTLQFLMRTKTYIMWPTDGKEDSRLNFWKRLKKAVVPTDGWDQEKKASKKQRHSIV